MNATSDYDAARAALGRTLPPYVSYQVTSHATGMGFAKDDTTTIVVRTRDGKIVKGTPPTVKIGAGTSYSGDVVSQPLFDVACYRATATRRDKYDGRPAEALSLNATGTCEHDRHGDFDTLYLDPTTHAPLAAVGNQHDDPVAVALSSATCAPALHSAVRLRRGGQGQQLHVLAQRRGPSKLHALRVQQFAALKQPIAKRA